MAALAVRALSLPVAVILLVWPDIGRSLIAMQTVLPPLDLRYLFVLAVAPLVETAAIAALVEGGRALACTDRFLITMIGLLSCALHAGSGPMSAYNALFGFVIFAWMYARWSRLRGWFVGCVAAWVPHVLHNLTALAAAFGRE